MVQQSLIYSFVARGTSILAEYTEFSGNFTSVASQCLHKLPSGNDKFTYNCDGYTFNYISDNGYIYCVVAEESAGRTIPIAFLERVKDDFNRRYSKGKATTAGTKGLNKEFGPKLKDHMKYCAEHPDEMNKLARVQAQVSEVKGVMMENIEKVLDRGERIEVLVDKTDDLRSQGCSGLERMLNWIKEGKYKHAPETIVQYEKLAGQQMKQIQYMESQEGESSNPFG